MASVERNALTVDVEDYYHVSAFTPYLKTDSWDQMPSRVERNVNRILDLFAAHGAKGTFFVLGWVAERYPELVRRVIEEGHEIASHGYSHTRATHQTREEFAKDIRATKAVLEDVSGSPVMGYRAPSFSICAANIWALEELRDAGYEYSSSIYPVVHDLYGMPEAPRFPFRPLPKGVLEVPISTVRLMRRNWPAGGGGYFRLLPYTVSRWLLQRINIVEGRPCIFYFHPWELDPEQPRVGNLGVKARFRHYVNLKKVEPRLSRLLTDFSWDRMDRVFLKVRA